MRDYDGPSLDGTVQYIGEAPHWQGDGETVDVVDDDPVGDEQVENIPNLAESASSTTGQSTFDDWGWSA